LKLFIDSVKYKKKTLGRRVLTYGGLLLVVLDVDVDQMHHHILLCVSLLEIL
jgi:hypothetical protein